MAFSGCRSALLVLVTVISGCASDRLAGPAATVSADVKSLQGELTNYQDRVGRWQSASTVRTTAYTTTMGITDAYTRQMQAQWALEGNTDASSLFVTLQGQGANAVAAWNSAAPTAAASSPAADPPSVKVVAVVSILDQLAKPAGARADTVSGYNYVQGMAKDLNLAKAQAASAPVAASAAKGK